MTNNPQRNLNTEQHMQSVEQGSRVPFAVSQHTYCTHMVEGIHTTDTFRIPMLVTERKWQVVPGALQDSIPGTMLAPVDTLMSASAFAQTKVLTSHRKAIKALIAKSYTREILINRLKKCRNIHESKA